MTRTLTRSYDSHATARSVVDQLEAAGVSSHQHCRQRRQD